MRTISSFSSGFANFAMLTRLAVGLSMGLLSSCAVEQPPADPTDTSADDDTTAPVCAGGRVHCFAHIKTSKSGAIRAYAAPQGFGPADLISAYKIDTNITTKPTVAIIDAFGYTALESDLAAYRTQYGLPACNKANGCLKIVNQTGATTPLPPNPPANDDWTVETALDVDMVSAACPNCNILVIQADNDQGMGLDIAQATAVALHATVISNSWGGAEQGTSALQEESYFNNPGVATFVSAGDNGYDDAGQGPDYPATSAHVIAVGGTTLVKDTSARGWKETAWTDGGSACSLSIPKPAYQGTTGCTYKSTTDIAAVGDPATGLAVYNAGSGGFIVVGGTSASSPMVAALFAETGHGALSDGTFIMQNAAMWNDVTSGKNGTCPANMAILCQAGIGWDGPTGYGTPNGDFLKGGGIGSGPTLAFASPSDGDHVVLGFQVIAQVGSGATSVELDIDGTMIDTLTVAPFQFSTPNSLTAGSHVVELIASDASGNQTTTSVMVLIGDGSSTGGGNGGTTSGDNSNDVVGGCSAGHGAGSGMAVLGVAIALGLRRRRRR